MIERQQRKDSIMGFTEDEMMGYVKYKRKQAVIKDSKVNEYNLGDQVCGTLNPIVHKLNKGLGISPNSVEHRMLIDLLSKANV